MPTTRRWNVHIVVDEFENGSTRAQARLETHTGEARCTIGRARHDPRDDNIPEIGDELAAARALNALADQLMVAAVEDIEAHAAARSPSQARGLVS